MSSSSSSSPPLFSTLELRNLFVGLTKWYTVFNVCVTLPIYVSVLTCIVRRRHKAPFNSAFFTIFVWLGVCDICEFLLYCGTKFTFWGWVLAVFYPLSAPNLAAKLVMYWRYVTLYTEELLNILLVANRFVAIVYGIFYKTQWTRKLTNWMIGSVLVFATLISAPLLGQNFGVMNSQMELEDNQTLNTTSGPTLIDPGKIFGYNLHTVFLIFELVLALCVTPVMWRQVRKLNLQDVRQRAEANLFYTLLFILVGHAPFACYMVIWIFLSFTYATLQMLNAFEWSWYVACDLYSMSSPYVMLLTCKQLRETALPFCLFHKGNSVAVNSNSSHSKLAIPIQQLQTTNLSRIRTSVIVPVG